MNSLLSLVLIAISILVVIPIAVFLVECLASLIYKPSGGKLISNLQEPNIAVLMPAHNEASGISITLNSLVSQVADRKQIVVVADNCTDNTAALAQEFGVTVLERYDLNCRGKGYALDYGLKFLSQNPPDVLVMVDADCTLTENTISTIAKKALAHQQPVQALYLMETPRQPSPKDCISALAFLVKNLVRPQGLAQLGFPCLLTGTGMAFPWSVISKASLASGNIVEDMQLGIDLALAGSAPILCTEGQVIGLLPQQENAAKTQRTRWEQGHLQTIFTQVPRLLTAFVQQKRLDLFVMALDLSVPPLSLLVMLLTSTLLISIGGGLFGLSWYPAQILGISELLLVTTVIAVWAKYGRSVISLKQLMSVPLYILWKLPVYLSIVKRPQQEWVRTERDMNVSTESEAVIK